MSIINKIQINSSVGKFDIEKIRFLIVGGFNTLFGYISGVGLYILLSDIIQTWVILILMNAVNITFSFLTYKLFVFRSRGKWLQEYIKSWMSYGGISLIGMTILMTLLNLFSFNIWISQAISLTLTAIISFYINKNFTFKAN